MFFASLMLLMSGSPATAAEAETGANADMAVHLRGVVLPVSQSKLGFSQAGMIVSLPDEGAVVRKGEVIARIDEKAVRADIAKSEAALATSQLGLELANHSKEKTIRLTKEKVVSDMALKEEEFKVRQAQAAVTQAEANLTSARLALAGCAMVAPFNGVVVARAAHLGEWIGVGASVLELADISRLEMTMDVPPVILEGLKPGTETAVLINEQKVGKAKARTILPLIDGGSGLRRVIWQIFPNKNEVLSGRYVSLEPWSNVR